MSETKGLLKREGKDNTDSVSDKLSDKQQLSDKMKLLSDKLSDKLLLSPLHPDSTMIGENAKRKMLEALVFLIDNPNSKTESISEALGLSKQSTRTYLQKLSEIGLIEPHGANKNRTYSLGDIFEEETGIVEDSVIKFS